MKQSIQCLLSQKGIIVPEHHLDELETRWSNLQELRKLTKDAKLDDFDISLKNVPGGDHIE